MTAQDAMQVLRQDYRGKVEQLAQVLAAMPVGTGEDGLAMRAAEAFTAECQVLACPTHEAARLVLALSPSWDRGEPWTYRDLREGAAVAVAIDAAELAGVRWLLDLHTPRG